MEVREDALSSFCHEVTSSEFVKEAMALDMLQPSVSKEKEPVMTSEKRIRQLFDSSTVYANEAFSRQPSYTEEEITKYQMFFESDKHASFLYEPVAKRILNVNEKACQQYSYSRGEFQKICLSDLYKEPTRSALHKQLSSRSFSADSLKSPAIHIDHKNRQLHVDISTHPIYYSKHNLFLIRTQDITPQTYEQKIQERLIAELRARNSELRQLAYISSHNLGAPVANLGSLLDLLERDKIDGKWNKEVIEKIEFSVKSLKETLSDLAQVAATHERCREHARRINLHSLCKKVCDQISEDIERSQAHIGLYFPQATIHQISTSMESIFLNLLTNAIKYCSPDRKLSIEISSEPHEHYTLLTFKDNGLGIDLEKFGDKLFGLYQRFHIGTAEGKGIGLYLVHAQVKALSGHIRVKSQKNQGTTFYIYLRDCKQHEKHMDYR